MLMVTEVEAVFPARSITVPVITWFIPSVVTVTGSEQVATPLMESEQAKVTVGSALWKLAAFGAGETDAEIIGSVLSTLSVTEVEAVFPARDRPSEVTGLI